MEMHLNISNSFALQTRCNKYTHVCFTLHKHYSIQGQNDLKWAKPVKYESYLGSVSTHNVETSIIFILKKQEHPSTSKHVVACMTFFV